jgi:hypothetical protein
MNPELAAVHESAHAAAAPAFVEQVEITDGGGRTRFLQEIEIEADRQVIHGLIKNEMLRQQAISLCAGRAAMLHLRNGAPDHGWRDSKDRRQAFEIALKLSCGDQTAAHFLLLWFQRRAETLTERRWPQITKLAHSLLEHKKLSGAAVRALLSES